MEQHDVVQPVEELRAESLAHHVHHLGPHQLDILAAQKEDEDVDLVRAQVMNVVRQAFRPEFLNRLDEIVLFHRLSREHMTGIVAVQLKHLQALLADRKLELQLDEGAKTWLADAGYDPVYGARPLKRVIQRELQNPLATRLLEGRFKAGDTIRVSADRDGLTIDGKKLSEAA